MMRTHKLPQTFWPFTADAAAFVKNVIPNIEGHIPYSAFYDKDPKKPFNLLQTFGCLAWVHIPKVKRKKLDDTTIPAIFVRYDKEHKGWKVVSQNHSPPIFWSNAARFIEDQSWNDQTDAIPIQEVDAIHYDDPMDIEHLGYTEEDVHDKGQQQVNDIYLPLEKQDPTPEGDCHGPECSGSRRVTGSYGRSTGIGELVNTRREHGRSAVSMETMDSYGFTCKGGLGPYARRASHKEDQAQGAGTATKRIKLKEQAQPRRGPSSRSMQMVTTQGLERQEPKEPSPVKGKEQCIGDRQAGLEEEEQCRRSRHSSGGQEWC
ncbi:uncharacterized protein UDID_19278 [Ustilago sp. UG-2017a]|nr:uncharacterized protein UDID_19278 [Ustilago sp. UG-2017a]